MRKVKSTRTKEIIVTVHIFQIGCRGFGRRGFEKLVDKERFFPEDVVLEAVCEKDFEHRGKAEKFAEASGSEVDFYEDVDKLYDAADSVEGTVLIYDAGPVQRHSDHIQRSLRNDFYHLSEKPPSTTREQHIQERKLAARHDVHFKVDFLERENPAFRKAREVLEDVEIDSIKVFRQSSTGVRRMLQPVKKAHVNEGCTLDEMIHDIYVMDLIDPDSLNLDKVENTVFMPKDVGSEKFLRIDGGTSGEISKRNSLGQVRANFSSGEVEISIDASWLGVTDSAGIWDRKVQEQFGEKLVQSEYLELDEKSFLDQKARFFVVEGEKNILADLLNFRLYDLDHGKEIEVDVYPRDQLYRVLEKAVVDTAEGDVEKPEEEKLDTFMNALFDVQERAAEESGDVFEELDSASELIRSMVVTDKAELDKEELKGVAS